MLGGRRARHLAARMVMGPVCAMGLACASHAQGANDGAVPNAEVMRLYQAGKYSEATGTAKRLLAIEETPTGKPEGSAMTVDQGAAFFVFALVAAITPGPSNTMIVATAAASGLRGGLPCVLGASAGMGTLLFCSALGLGQLIIAQPILLRVLNWGGAAFLLWLAWKIANAGRVSDMTAARPVGFLGATAFQWINPKGWLVAVSAAATYLQAVSGNALSEAMAFGGLFFAAALPSGLVWLALGATVHVLLRDDRSARVFNIAMGVALAASVAMMLR
jgi:threonine/homoserine/homoserine lactone efflux protein